MSESEAYELLMLITSQTQESLFGYFGIVSAFLIMSYLAADKLTPILSTIVILLFTLCATYIALILYALNIDLDNLYAEMLSKKQTGEYELAWFGNNPIEVALSITYVQILITGGGYIGALFFFFYSRASGSKHDDA